MNCPASRLIRMALVALVFLLPALSGCSGLRNDYPEKDLFRLSARLPAGLKAHSTQARWKAAPPLLVQQLDISPEFETDALVYRIGENRFQSDFYHSFAVSPARMITDIVRETLFSSGLFTLAGPASISGKRYQLRGKIIDLYADLRDKDRFRGVVTLRLILETPAGNAPGTVVQKVYREALSFSPMDPDLYIDSLNRGLTRILTDFIRDIQAAVP